MFTVNDFIKLMKYFKTGSIESNLDQNLIIQAEDSKARTTTLFNENIDLTCYSTDDYKRLKNFLINWYASLRTFSSVMKNASDVRSLPDEHLNELIRSFGFTESLKEITYQNKIDFFYDLVNLYKIKGTPESIIRVLSYYGISNIQFSEYWLQYDENGDLVFHPETISTTNSRYYSSRNIDFDYVISRDPHWMLSKDQITRLFLSNKIAFPSKTPYFGIKPFSQGSGDITDPTISILSRLVQDQYASFSSGNPPPKNIILTLNITSSLLDLYLGCLYAFNLIYPKSHDSLDQSFLIYNGSLTLSNEEIVAYYKTLGNRSNLQSRQDIDTNRALFYNTFTRLRTTSFISQFNSSRDVLSLTNPDLKYLIDGYELGNNTIEILKILLNDLTSWIKDNIIDNPQDLTIYLLGFTFLDYATELVNFFKPYRARLLPATEQAYVIENPLMDTVISDDNLAIEIDLQFLDWDVANSSPGYLEDFIPEGLPVTSTPISDVCRRITDIYVDSTGTVKVNYIDSTAYTNITNIVYSEPEIGQYRITNIYLYVNNGNRWLYVDYDAEQETIGGIKTEVVSLAPSGFHTITDVYLNGLGQFEIVYDNEEIIWPIDSTARVYFSREVYDTGSYFDIGASVDQNEHESNFNTEIIQRDSIVFDYHEGDATSCVNVQYSGVEDGTTWYAFADGGFVDFDYGGVFDAPAVSDIFKITVIPPPMEWLVAPPSLTITDTTFDVSVINNVGSVRWEIQGSTDTTISITGATTARVTVGAGEILSFTVVAYDNRGSISQRVALSMFETYFEMLPREYAAPQFFSDYHLYVDSAESVLKLDPTLYDGVLSWEFEVIAWNNHVMDLTLSVIDSNNVICGSLRMPGIGGESDGPAPEPTWGILRQRTTFTPTSSDTYRLRLSVDELTPVGDVYPPVSWHWNYLYCLISTARIICTQSNATKTQLQIPLMAANYDEWAFQQSYEPLRDSNTYLYFPSQLSWPWDMPSGRAIYSDTNYEGIFDYEACSIWKYDRNEIGAPHEVVFSVCASGHPGPNATVRSGTIYSFSYGLPSGTPYTEIYGCLYWAQTPARSSECPPNGATPDGWVNETQVYVDDTDGTIYRPIPGSYFHRVGSPCHPFTEILNLDFTGISTGTINFYFGGKINSTGWGTSRVWTGITIAAGKRLAGGQLKIKSTDASTFSIYFGYQIADIGDEPKLSVALLNKTTGNIVGGSELTWVQLEEINRKYTNPLVLDDSCEYCVAVKSLSINSGEVIDSQLHIKINPIDYNTLASWQRVTNSGSDHFDNYYPPDEWLNNGIESRVKLKLSNSEVLYEQTAYPQWGGLTKLVDMVTEDDLGSGGSDVLGGTLTYPELDEPIRMRTEELTLTDEHRYTVRTDYESSWIIPVNGFLVVKPQYPGDETLYVSCPATEGAVKKVYFFKSLDFGATWTSSQIIGDSGNIAFSAPICASSIYVYVATNNYATSVWSSNLFVSTDNGTSWYTTYSLPFAIVTMNAVGKTVVAVTHGSGTTYEIRKSTDGGQNFYIVYTFPGTFGNVGSLYWGFTLRHKGNNIVCTHTYNIADQGDNIKYVYSTDAGTSWSEVTTTEIVGEFGSSNNIEIGRDGLVYMGSFDSAYEDVKSNNIIETTGVVNQELTYKEFPATVDGVELTAPFGPAGCIRQDGDWMAYASEFDSNYLFLGIACVTFIDGVETWHYIGGGQDDTYSINLDYSRYFEINKQGKMAAVYLYYTSNGYEETVPLMICKYSIDYGVTWNETLLIPAVDGPNWQYTSLCKGDRLMNSEPTITRTELVVVGNTADIRFYDKNYTYTGTTYSTSYTYDITIDANYVWRYNSPDITQFYKTTLQPTGRTVNTGYTSAIHADFEALWANVNNGHDIAKYNKATLELIESHGLAELGYAGYIVGVGDITSDGTYLYVADSTGLRVIKYLKNPFTYISEVGLPSWYGSLSLGVSVSGDYAYLTSYNQLRKINKATWEIVATFGKAYGGEIEASKGGLRDPYDVVTHDTRVFVVAYEGLIVLNQSDLSYITYIPRDVDGWWFKCAVDDSYIYIADNGGALISKWDINTYEFVSENGDRTGATDDGPNAYSSPYGIGVDETYVYVLDQGDDVRVIRRLKSDLSYVDEYRDVGWLIFGNPQALMVYGNYIYVSDPNYPSGIHRIDKTTMTYVDFINIDENEGGYTYEAEGMFVDGGNIYIADHATNRCCERYTFPDFVYVDSAPATYGDPNYWMMQPEGITVDETYIYVSLVQENKIKIYDKTTLVYAGEVVTSAGQPWKIAVDNTSLYVGIYAGPSNHRLVKYFKTDPYSLRMNIAGCSGGSLDTAWYYQLGYYPRNTPPPS